MLKKISRKLHLWLSLPVGLFISIICLTGAILTFEKEITEGLNKDVYKVYNAPSTPMLSPSAVLERVKSQVSDTLILSSIQIPAKKDAPMLLSFENAGRRSLSVNPYTGEVMGWTKSYSFFSTTRRLHRFLLNAPKARGEQSIGKMIVGVSTLAMVFILLSGLIIWIPKTAKMVKVRLKVSLKRGWYRLWHDWHVAFGFYALLLLLLMALTGLTWSFGWYRNMTYTILGAKQPTQQRASGSKTTDKKTAPRNTEQKANRKKSRPRVISWDTALLNINQAYPSHQGARLSANNEAQVTLNAHIRGMSDVVKFNQDGQIISIEKYADKHKSQKLRGWLFSLHTGTWGGFWSKLLYLIVASVGGLLPITGYYVWLKKKRR